MTKRVIKFDSLANSVAASDQATAQALEAAEQALSTAGVNPDYISYQKGVLPDSTGATEETIGAYFTAEDVLQKIQWDGSEWQDIGQPISTKKYVNDKASLLQDQVDAFADGTGKTHTSLTAAMAVDPLPNDNVPFRVNGDTEDDGNYIYDSSEQDGYKFLSELVNQSDIKSLLNSIITVGEPFEV